MPADTFTPNYNMTLPGIGGDSGTWGTLLNENFTTLDGMLALAGTVPMTGALKLKYASPAVILEDTAQTLPAGLWKLISTADQLEVQRNTATAGDFSTSTLPLFLDQTDTLHVAGPLSITGATTSTGGILINNAGNTTAFTVESNSSNGANINLFDSLTNTHKYLRCTNNIFEVVNNAYSNVPLQMDDTGNLTMQGNVTAFSDERLKKDWESMPDSFLQDVAELRCGTYTRIDTNERQAGTSAQDLQRFFPEVVHDVRGTLAVAYGNAALVMAVCLAREVMTLKTQMAAILELLS